MHLAQAAAAAIGADQAGVRVASLPGLGHGRRWPGHAIEVFGCDFYLLFGQTEMSPTAAIVSTGTSTAAPGALGTPVVDVQVAIMDEQGRLLQQGSKARSSTAARTP